MPSYLYITKIQLLAIILQVISLSCRSFPLGMTKGQSLVQLYNKQINQETFSSPLPGSFWNGNILEMVKHNLGGSIRDLQSSTLTFPV